MSGKKTKLANKELVKSAGFWFVLFIICVFFSPSEGKPNIFVSFGLVISFFAFIGVIVYIILRAIKNILFFSRNIDVINSNIAVATNKEFEKHRACFGSKKASVQTAHITIQTDDGEYEQRERYFKDFRNSLTKIWNSGVFLISLEYSGRKRELLLETVQINSHEDVYFSGYCFDSNEEHTFKTERFDSYV